LLEPSYNRNYNHFF